MTTKPKSRRSPKTKTNRAKNPPKAKARANPARARKAVYERFIQEAVNQGRLDAVDELVAAQLKEHEILPTGSPVGRQGVRESIAQLRRAFPDLEVTIEDEITQGDRLVARTRWCGTHEGEIYGVPATGRRVEFESIEIVRIDDGQIAEHWAVTDNLGLMQQLGAMPEAFEPAEAKPEAQDEQEDESELRFYP